MTGERLGAHGPPVPVEVAVEVPGTPTFWQRLSLQTPPPVPVKMTVYVCCPRCVAKVRSDPSTYLAWVLADRAGR